MFQVGDFLIALRKLFLKCGSFFFKEIRFSLNIDELSFVLRDLFLEFLILLPEAVYFPPHFFENGGKTFRNSRWDAGF